MHRATETCVKFVNNGRIKLALLDEAVAFPNKQLRDLKRTWLKPSPRKRSKHVTSGDHVMLWFDESATPVHAIVGKVHLKSFHATCSASGYSTSGVMIADEGHGVWTFAPLDVYPVIDEACKAVMNLADEDRR